MKIEEGFIDFKGFRTWYRRVGQCEGNKVPLLVLHGGPGCCHDYLESLDDLAMHGREVIYYDQLGCGKSSTPSQPEFWTTTLWEEEIDVIREGLGLKEIHLLGQSWGGMLAMQYAIHGPKGIKSMIIASSPASMVLWEKEAKRLMTYLPEKLREAIETGEKTGDRSSDAYKEGYKEYYRRHVCNLDPYPDYVKRSFDEMSEVYEVMEGPSEFSVTGKLKGWDITDQLHKITIPTLLTSGTDDEATPLIVKNIVDRIPNCQWELLPGTHFVHVEQKETYNTLIESYMQSIEQKSK